MKKCLYCGDNTKTPPMCSACVKNTLKGIKCKHKDVAEKEYRGKLYELCYNCGFMRRIYRSCGKWRRPPKLTDKELGN